MKQYIILIGFSIICFFCLCDYFRGSQEKDENSKQIGLISETSMERIKNFVYSPVSF